MGWEGVKNKVLPISLQLIQMKNKSKPAFLLQVNKTTPPPPPPLIRFYPFTHIKALTDFLFICLVNIWYCISLSHSFLCHCTSKNSTGVGHITLKCALVVLWLKLTSESEWHTCIRRALTITRFYPTHIHELITLYWFKVSAGVDPPPSPILNRVKLTGLVWSRSFMVHSKEIRVLTFRVLDAPCQNDSRNCKLYVVYIVSRRVLRYWLEHRNVWRTITIIRMKRRFVDSFFVFINENS